MRDAQGEEEAGRNKNGGKHKRVQKGPVICKTGLVSTLA